MTETNDRGGPSDPAEKKAPDGTRVDALGEDVVLRAMTDDGAFRVMVARTTGTVREAIAKQSVTGRNARNFGDLLTATVLFRETMAPQLRVQGVLRGARETGTFVADSRAGGLTRGLVQMKAGAEHVEIGEGTLLQMMRTLHDGSINRGIVYVPEGGSISVAMMEYMQTSEQVDTMLAVGTTFDAEGRVIAAGGYLVQLLPEVGRGPLMVMAERLEDFRTIDHLLGASFSPVELRNELLYGMPFTHLDETPVRFDCWCSEARLVAALATLERSEIKSMIDDGAPLEITCDYCGKEYRIQPSTLQGLLQQS